MFALLPLARPAVAGDSLNLGRGLSGQNSWCGSSGWNARCGWGTGYGDYQPYPEARPQDGFYPSLRGRPLGGTPDKRSSGSTSKSFVTCQEARQRVMSWGFRLVETRSCGGRFNSFTGERDGRRWVINVENGSGSLLGVRRLPPE